jgi:hypothetical protein
MKSTTKRVNLDWSKLLGFNQLKSQSKGSRAMVGGKPASMIGVKVGSKVT